MRGILNNQKRFFAVKAANAQAIAAARIEEKAKLEKMRKEWKSDYVEMKSRRTGVIAMKMGMTCLNDANGIELPITVLKMEDVTVLQERTFEKNGYYAVQLGAGPVKAKHVNIPQIGEFVKLGNELKRYIQEFRVSKDCLLPQGSVIDVRHFVPGQKVDVQGTTVGKGFQGVMKRWGFSGLPASHGVSRSHRSAGATGSRQDPGKVWPGKKMAGRMGGKTRTVQNVRVIAIDPVRALLFLHGQVPGNPGSIVRVTDAIKLPGQFREHNMNLPFPTFTGDSIIKSTSLGPDDWLYDPKFKEVREEKTLAAPTEKKEKGGSAPAAAPAGGDAKKKA